jgi:hypothetical protein
LIIANHPTLIDVVLIVAFTPAPTCVVKAALFEPFLRRVLRAAGYPEHPTDTMIERAAAVRGGHSGDVPGGTRPVPTNAVLPPRHGQRGVVRRRC